MASSSRLRESVATIFDVCCEVQAPTGAGGGEAFLLVLYPPEYADDSTLRSIKQFCFPCGSNAHWDDNEAVQLFTFVLTDASSQYTFAYCRYTPRSNTCLCILSGLTWVNLFYKLLNHLSTVMNKATKADVDSLLTNCYHLDIPDPGAKFRLTACTPIGKFVDEVPDDSRLPTLKHDKLMLEFFNVVSDKQMLALYTSLLRERRIVFTSRKLGQLSSCVFAAARLLFPFHWQGIFIPVLPAHLNEMLTMPMPYLVGVPKQTFQGLGRQEMGEVVIVDLDEKTFESPHNDLLPAEAATFLRQQLKSSSEMFLSDALARAFLQTHVIIFGQYSLGFVQEGDGLYTWDREVFLGMQRPSLQPFLREVDAQYFERFIEERLKALNAGTPILDEFQLEIEKADQTRFNERPGSRPEMLQQAVSSVRDNASDVIGALKDRVQGISIKDRFSRIAPKPKEVRRHKLRSGVKPKKKPTTIDPLYVDAAHYDFSTATSTTSSTTNGCLGVDEEGSLRSVSDAESVKSGCGGGDDGGDLIDLSDDKSSGPRSLIDMEASVSTLSATATTADGRTLNLSPTNPFISEYLHASGSGSASGSTNVKPPPHHHPIPSIALPPPAANSITSTTPSSSPTPPAPKRRNNWETFD